MIAIFPNQEITTLCDGKSKEDLAYEILRLRKENQLLQEQLQKEKEQKESLQKSIGITKAKVRKRKKKPGRKVGHIWCTRKKT